MDKYKTPNTKIVIIFSGFNMRAVYAFIRTLEKLTMPYAIIASSPEDDIFKTAYKKQVVAIRKHSQLVLEDIIESIKTVQQKTRAERCFIAPSTEALNRFILDNRNQFEKLNCTIPLIDKKLYKEISDKQSFGKLCKKYNILIPEEYSIFNIQIPCVAKPKMYVGSLSQKIFNPIIITNEDQLEDFLNNHNLDDFYFQEFLEGRSLYLLYYFYNDGTFMKYSQENFIQQSEGGSILAAKSSDFYLSQYSEPYEKLFESVNYRGLLMIETKLTQEGAYMIEANPRFWGPSQLFVDAEVNFFDAMLYDYEVIASRLEYAPDKNQEICYFWDDGESYRDDNIDNTAFHNYSKEMFFKEYNYWDKCNILRREDTLEIHKKLMQGIKNAK